MRQRPALAAPNPTPHTPRMRHKRALSAARALRHRTPTEEDTMAKIEKSIDVNVPVRTVYNQWTQFEEFPRFMEGVEQVQQIDDTHLRWVANVAGKRKEWTARIAEQI